MIAATKIRDGMNFAGMFKAFYNELQMDAYRDKSRKLIAVKLVAVMEAVMGQIIDDIPAMIEMEIESTLRWMSRNRFYFCADCGRYWGITASGQEAEVEDEHNQICDCESTDVHLL